MSVFAKWDTELCKQSLGSVAYILDSISVYANKQYSGGSLPSGGQIYIEWYAGCEKRSSGGGGPLCRAGVIRKCEMKSILEIGVLIKNNV